MQEDLGSNLKVQSISDFFSTVYSYLLENTIVVLFLIGSFGCLFLAFLPWYSWFIGFFSIPVAIIDIVLVNIFKGNLNSSWSNLSL